MPAGAEAALPPEPLPSPWAVRALGRRRTWVALFLLAYAILLSASWRLLLSVRAWYSVAVAAPSAAPWPALYASVLCGGLFGLLSMAAALAVALPAMVTTWITVLVLLTFAGKPRWALVREGRRATADIAGIALRVLVREGNLVAAFCAVVSFAALLRYREEHAAASR